MTIGQRIAERRKLLGISQENLGERMGVSRQAISKWEADGAIPEIDKLIALSKLFDVRVGWLLGTEEAAPEEEPRQDESLSEAQLKMVEQIVLKYQQSRPEPKRNPVAMLICLGCAVLALVISLIGLSKTNKPMSELFGDLTLLAEFEAEFTALPDWENAGVVFRAVPKALQEGDTAYLILRQNGRERYQVPCSWDGAAFSAKMEAAYGAYESYFILCHGDGTKEQQNVSEAFYGLPYELKPVCEIKVLEMGIAQGDAGLDVGNLVMRVEPPWIMGQEEGLKWTRLDLVIYDDGEVPERFDLLELCEITSSLAPDSVDSVSDHLREAYLRLERNVPLEINYVGYLRTAYIEGVLSNGYTFRQNVDWLALGNR